MRLVFIRFSTHIFQWTHSIPCGLSHRKSCATTWQMKNPFRRVHNFFGLSLLSSNDDGSFIYVLFFSSSSSMKNKTNLKFTQTQIFFRIVQISSELEQTLTLWCDPIINFLSIYAVDRTLHIYSPLHWMPALWLRASFYLDIIHRTDSRARAKWKTVRLYLPSHRCKCTFLPFNTMMTTTTAQW